MIEAPGQMFNEPLDEIVGIAGAELALTEIADEVAEQLPVVALTV